MKINSMPPVSKVEQYKIQRQATETQSLGKSIGTDEMNLSSDATLFSETMKAARASVSERLSGEGIDVDSVKSQIESGSYSVDEKQLAESILMLSGYYENRGNINND